jgi:hypothetical protein
MRLKRGSWKSFFKADTRVWGSTSAFMNIEKSDSPVRLSISGN